MSRHFCRRIEPVLFKKKKNTPESGAVQTIRPVVVRTENVAKELMNVAASNKVASAVLDFNILDVQTMKRTAENAEWEELASDEVAKLADNAAILDGNLQIRQLYEVEIFTKADPDPLDSLEIKIGANSTLCKVYMTIKPGSNVTYFQGFEEGLKRAINKKKLRARLLIHLFDKPMAEAVKNLAARVRVNEEMTFEKQEMLLIAEGIEPVPTVHDALIMHYEKKKETGKQEGDRVDYSKRGYLVSAVENELLIEYVKPKKGKAGRNCRGELLVPEEPVVANEPTFGISEKIERVEKEETIEYRAKQSGYVTFEGGNYDINSEMDVSEISFKTTGSIDTGLDADIALNVKEADVFKDAIGMGMEVEVNEINIEGNIGPGSKVRANKATIEGQTHQTSEVYAEELRINIHKGKAFGKHVHVTRLENGVIEGEKVTVLQATGGRIRAREIEIEILGSHVQMTATDRIEVQQLKGSENSFVIDPIVMHSSREELSENEAKIKEAKRAIEEVQREIGQYEALQDSNAAAFADLKKRLLQYKKSGVQMPTAFVKKYKQFQQMQTHLESLRKELSQKEERMEMLSAKHHAFQSDILESKVICHDQWKGHNEIIFRLIEPEIEVSFVPPEFSTSKVFRLQEDEDAHYFIAAVES
jgi:hypothetical protein